MNSFNCELCSKNFTLKQNLTKHIKNFHNPEVIKTSKVTNNLKLNIEEKNNEETIEENNINTRIIELEYELKLKDIEIKNLHNEYNLKLQMKDLQIQSLEFKLNQPVFQQVQATLPLVQATLPLVQKQVQQPVSQPAKKLRTKLSTIEYLENNFKNAIPIEECHYLFLNCENNKCLHEEQFAGKDGVNKNIINQKYLLERNFTDSTSGNAMDIIADLFLKIDKTQVPFYCSDKQRNTLYIKTNTGWIKSTEREFDKILFTFIKYALWSVSNSVINTINIFKTAPSKFKEIYNKTYEDWLTQDKPDLLKKLIILEEETEDKKLSIKKLKILMAKLSVKGDNDDSDEEPEA
jgi:hypothetical protein